MEIKRFNKFVLESLKDTHDIEEVHISEIRQGDTILHNGVDKTVTGKDIIKSEDGDISIFGDSYKAGNKKVKRFIFKINR